MYIRRIPSTVAYNPVFLAMKKFTEERTFDTPDQLWQVEHQPVYTLGQAGKYEHLLSGSSIPIVQTNRGGQITYHGPGQVVIYPLLNLRRLGLFVKEYVHCLEETILLTLQSFGISNAQRKWGAPGVYVPIKGDLAKIAALGVKVSNGCTYHGFAVNVNMDLAPFTHINPCGYSGLQTIDMNTLGIHADWQEVADRLSTQLMESIVQK